MILSGNDLNVAVSSQVGSYPAGCPVIIPDFAVERVSVFVFTNEVYMQVTEDGNHPPAFSNPGETELHLYKGFNTLEPIQPWTAFRFRAINGVATVTYRAYAGGVPGA